MLSWINAYVNWVYNKQLIIVLSITIVCLIVSKIILNKISTFIGIVNNEKIFHNISTVIYWISLSVYAVFSLLKYKHSGDKFLGIFIFILLYVMAYFFFSSITKQLNYQTMLNFYSEQIKIEPDKTINYINRGRLLAKRNLNEAITDFSKAIEIDPQCEDAYLYRGLAKTKLGEDGFQDLLTAKDDRAFDKRLPGKKL
jgi:tetratricopeptide (TPR) repeat protein